MRLRFGRTKLSIRGRGEVAGDRSVLIIEIGDFIAAVKGYVFCIGQL